MFVDLMHDLANTFTERFLKAQLVFNEAPQESFKPPSTIDGRFGDARPAKRFNAMGILEDVPAAEVETDGGPTERAVESPVSLKPVTRGTPAIVGAGALRSLEAGGGALPGGWENTPRNNACPCGSGKKFKKCHGANL